MGEHLESDAGLAIWVVGLRVDSEEPNPTYYTVSMGDDETPLLINERIVLYCHPDLLGAALTLAGVRTANGQSPGPEPPDLVCDLAEALYQVENEDQDESAAIVNCLNLLLDVTAATNGCIPVNYRKALSDFADHLTFSKSIGSFFGTSQYARSQIIDGLLWCVGWIMTHARILDCEHCRPGVIKQNPSINGAIKTGQSNETGPITNVMI